MIVTVLIQRFSALPLYLALEKIPMFHQTWLGYSLFLCASADFLILPDIHVVIVS